MEISIGEWVGSQIVKDVIKSEKIECTPRNHGVYSALRIDKWDKKGLYREREH